MPGAKGGSGGGTNTVVQQQNQPNPAVQAAYQNLTNSAFTQAGQPQQQYTGPLAAGFSPNQLQAMGTVQGIQGAYAPYLSAAGQQFQQATKPLWPSLPQFDTTGLPQAGATGLGTAQQYGAAAGDAAANLTNNAYPYAALATQPVTTQPYTNFGLGTAQQIPGQVAPYSGLATSAAGSAPGLIGTYQSPYTQNVTSALQNLFDQQNAQQQQQVAGSTVGAGAYGGDRQAVAQALTAGQQQLTEAPIMAQTLQQGYQQAVQAAQQQAALQAQTGLGAGQLTSQTGLGAGQLGLGAGQLYTQGALGQGQLGLGAGQLINQAGTAQGQLGLGAGQLNLAAGQGYFNEFNQQQQAQLAAEQANAWLASQAGFGTASLGQQAQGLGLAGAQAELGTGGMQQQLAQEQLNIPYEQFLAQQAYPYQQMNFLAPIVEGTGSLAGGTSSTSYPGPSLLGQAAGLGVTGLGAYGLLNNSGALSGLGSLFGGSAGPVDAATLYGGADAAAAAQAAFDSSIGGTFTSAVTAASPFGLRSGGRIGCQSGGGLGSDPNQFTPGHLPSVPKLGLDYIVPAGPAVKGEGPPRAPAIDQSKLSGGAPSLNQDISAASQAVKLGGFGKDAGGEWSSADAGSAFGGRIGMPRIGMGLGNLGTSMTHLGLGAHPHMQSGGNEDPLTAAAPLQGVSPNVQTSYQQYQQMPLEQLQELSLRVPPGTAQGQLIQRALMAKRMTPSAGTAQPMAQPQQMPTSYLPLQPPATTSNPNAGMAEGGTSGEEPNYVTEDEIDPHPVVDHSGPTVVVHYPSEKVSLDLGLPSMQRRRLQDGGPTDPLSAIAAAGASAPPPAAAPPPPAATPTPMDNASLLQAGLGGVFGSGPGSSPILPDGAPPIAYALGGGFGGASGSGPAPPPSTGPDPLLNPSGVSPTTPPPAPPAASPAPAAAAAPAASATPPPPFGASTPAQQAVLQNALVGPPAPNPGFGNIQTPPMVNVGQATIPQPMTYKNIQAPGLSPDIFTSGGAYGGVGPAGISPSGLGVQGYNFGLPQLSAGTPPTTLPASPSLWPFPWIGAHGGGKRGGRMGFQDGGDTDEVSPATREILAARDKEDAPPPSPTRPPSSKSDVPGPETIGPPRPGTPGFLGIEQESTFPPVRPVDMPRASTVAPKDDPDRAFRTLMAARGEPMPAPTAPGLGAARPSAPVNITEDPARTIGTTMSPAGLGAPSRPDLETTRAAPGMGALPGLAAAPAPTAPQGPADRVVTPHAPATPSAGSPMRDALPIHPEVHRYFGQTGLPAELEPVLSRIVSGEAQRPNEIYGGGSFNDYSHHPNIVVPITSGPHAGETSTAAGLPQFLKTTWDQVAAKPGVIDPNFQQFSPVNQLRGAADLATTEYRNKTGRDLMADARAGNVNYAALAGQWPSLTSGQYSGEYESVLRSRAGAPGVLGGGLGTPRVTGAVPSAGYPPAGGGEGLGRVAMARPMANADDWTRSPWMAVMSAGLGMMASPSHYPLQQIGQGGLQGIKTAEEIANRDLRERQIQNEAEYRNATLSQTGAYHQGELQQRGAQLQAEQGHWQAQIEAENRRFAIAEKNANTQAERADNLARHQANTDQIMAGYRASQMAKPLPGYDKDAAGNIVYGTHNWDPEKGSYVFTPGATVGRPTTAASGGQRFDRMKAAYLAVHPGDEQGALDYAGGKKPMTEQEMVKSGEAHAAAEIKSIQSDILNPMRDQYEKMTPEQRDAYAKQRTQFWAQQIRAGFSGTEALAVPPTTPAAAPTQAKPPDAAVDYLKKHPDMRDQFDQKYGPGAANTVLGAPTS